jgi:hypothetical protein
MVGLQNSTTLKNANNCKKPKELIIYFILADADFSCFADLALASPSDYYKEGEGSLLQLVLTPGDPFIKAK